MKLFALVFALMTSSAFAFENVRVLEDVIPHYSNRTLTSSAKFQMDKSSTLGYAVVEVTEQYNVTYWETICHHPSPAPGPGRGPVPGPICRQVPRTHTEYNTIYQHSELIPNLVLEGNKIVYQGENGNVECGTLGTSRVFRRPTLYLNGKCTLESKVVRDRADKKVIVDFKVK